MQSCHLHHQLPDEICSGDYVWRNRANKMGWTKLHWWYSPAMMPDVVAASPPVTRPAPGSRAPGINFHFITAAAVICISSSSLSSSSSSAQSSLSPDTSCLASPSCLSVSFVPYCFLALHLHVGLGHLYLDRVFLGAACYSSKYMGPPFLGDNSDRVSSGLSIL